MSSSNKTMFSPPPGATITPYTGVFGKTQLFHLLRRTLFGVSPADMKAFEGKTLDQVVTALLNVNPIAAPPVKNYTTNGVDDYDIASTTNPKWTGLALGETWVNYRIEPGVAKNPDGVRRASLKSWWTQLMIEQERNLREKMTLFWHNHLVTEMVDVNNAQLSYGYISLLRENALGNYKDFVKKITLNPAMLVYLNGNTNDGSNAKSVNENYGRELQELFCIGKGAGSKYTEDDVKAAARVLSGWVINTNKNYDAAPITLTSKSTDAVYKNIDDPSIPMKAYFFPTRHDKTDKQFSAFYGNKVITGKNTITAGQDEINELIDMLFSVDELSKFICRKLFTCFVHYSIDANVEKDVIEPLAEIFRKNNYEIMPVLKALFTSDYFFKADYQGAMIKSPIDFCIGHARMLQIPLPTDPKAFEAKYTLGNNIMNNANNIGQNLGDPPNVAGWAAYYQEPLYYEVWIDSVTYPARKGFHDTFQYGTGTNYFNAESKSLTIKYDFVAFAKQMSNPSDPNQLISDIAEYLHPTGISKTVKDKLKTTYLFPTDAAWTTAYNTYIADPKTTNASAKLVPEKIRNLFKAMFFAAEYHLH